MSHLRCDGLLIGVLVSYLYNFLPGIFTRAKKYALFLLLICFGLISIIFYADTKSFFLLTIGFDLIAIGFSLLLVLNLIFKENTLYLRLFKNPIISLFALIGQYSYSIYLWHIVIAQLLNHYFNENVPVFIYFLSAITLGMLFSILIEQPVLKLREKIKISTVISK
jgi:peptidoglycan/LPS O-acetylase OafA/YrhL